MAKKQIKTIIIEIVKAMRHLLQQEEENKLQVKELFNSLGYALE